MPEEVKPNDTLPADMPHNKADWEKLWAENPQRWKELTQANEDRRTRESREAKEQLEEAKKREKNLLAEVEKYKKPVEPPPVVPADEPQQYGNGKYPQTDEEWDNLFYEKPAFANDLRNQFNSEQRRVQDDWSTARKNAAKKVQEEHPDMYLYQLDESGKPKRDEKGKFLNLINPTTGLPDFNPESEKGKLWLEIWDEGRLVNGDNSWNYSKNAPSLMMAEMERRLRQKGANMVNQNQGQNSTTNADESALAPQGVTPPKSDSLKFVSEQERALAERGVKNGIYKSLEEYCNWRDKGIHSYAEQNSRPDFSKK